MKTFLTGSFLCLISFLIAGCSSSSSSDSYVRAGYDFAMLEVIAIVDVVGEVNSERAKNQISDLFTMQLLRKGFAPIQREHVMRQLNENGFERGNLSPEAYAIEAGRALKIKAVLIVTVPTFGTESSLTAKIMEVENGSALWLGSGSKASDDQSWYSAPGEPVRSPMPGGIFDQSGNLRNLQKEAALKKQPTDYALSPREIDRFNAIVKDICKTIPFRSAAAEPPKSLKPW